MGATLVWLAVAALLLAAAALKAADRPGSTVALGTYGIPGALATPVWAGLVAIEAGLAAAIAAGSGTAAHAAGGLLAVFLCAQLAALARGGAGTPCGCLGGAGRLGRASAARTAVLAVACAALPALGAGPAVPLGAAAAVAAAVVVLAAGRRSGPAGALEVAGEGPELHAPTPLADHFAGAEGDLRLAVFTAAGCGLCRRIDPAAAALGARGVPVAHFDQHADAEAWAAADVPGAPYALAIDAAGIVLAKGTVNAPEQLESVLATAQRRAAEGIGGRNHPEAGPDGTAVGPDEPVVGPAHEVLGGGASRRGFLAGAGAGVAGASGAGALVAPGAAHAYHFCGHIYTTDSCPHPTGLPRIDRRGLPLRRDGRRIDDLGRLIDRGGRPLDESGRPLADLEGRLLPPAPRTPVCVATGRAYGIRVRTDGAWYRCCDGRVRKLVDCCSPSPRRINGDASLRGYCYGNRKVFCVMYFQSSVPC